MIGGSSALRPLRVGSAAGLLAALGIYVTLAVSAAAGKSNTFDEIAHLTAGYSYWAFGDYRLQPENGNWPQRIAGAPAALRSAAFPSREEVAWQQSDVWTVGDKFFFDQGNDIDRYLFEGRFLVSLIGAALGALVCVWARRLTGATGGWIALGLFVLSPTMLAHGALVTSDMAAAFGFLVALGALWILLHRITPVTIGASVLAVVWLALAKFSAALIVPMAALLVAIRWRWGGPWVWRARRRSRRLVIDGLRPRLVVLLGLTALHIIVVWVAVWASYGFRYSAFAGQSDVEPRFLTEWSTVLAGPEGGISVAGRMVDWARGHHVLPEAYLYGFSHTMRFSQARPSFLNGEVVLSGRLSFFPYAFAVKTTFPMLGLLLLGVTGMCLPRAARGRRPRWFMVRRRLYRAAPLLVLIAVYGAAALSTNLNIGHRHLLPLYPALMVLAGYASLWLRRTAAPSVGGNRAKRARLRTAPTAMPRRTRPSAVALTLVAGLGVWHMVESLRTHPDYLAYFNQLAGGPDRAYTHLVDSSLDWGQDLPALKTWLDRHVRGGSDPEAVYLSYFGTSRPTHFGIEAVQLPGFLDRRPRVSGEPLRAGVYAISATMLQGVYGITAGRWGPVEETQYRDVETFVREVLADPERRAEVTREAGQEVLPELLDTLEKLRFARLTAYLRRQPPLAKAGYSILIYRLSDADLQQALSAPLR